MKSFVLGLCLSLLAPAAASALPCAPDTLQGYIGLGSGGCTVGGVLLASFGVAPGQSFATPIDPATIQVTPGGTSLQLTFGANAGAADLLESFFHFTVSAADLLETALAMAGASATGDGAVTAALDVCGDGLFSGNAPIGCSGSAATLILFAIESDALLADAVSVAPATFLDVFADIVIDGGPSGSGALGSVTLSFTVPEPSLALLLAAALAGFARRRLRLALAAALAFAFAAAPAGAAPLDHEAQISDVFAFRSYDGGTTPRVALVLCLDPWQEPAEGPSWRPFDPEVLYELKLDNNNDAVEDIVFQFRFATEQRLPNVAVRLPRRGGRHRRPCELAGPGSARHADRAAADHVVQLPGPRPAPVLHGDDDEGRRRRLPLTGVGPFFAVPPNVGPRTLDYDALFRGGDLDHEPAERQGLRRRRRCAELRGDLGGLLRHAQPALDGGPRRPQRCPGCGQRERRERHGVGLRRERHRDRAAGFDGDAHRRRRAVQFHGRHDRRLGSDVAAPCSPRGARRCRRRARGRSARSTVAGIRGSEELVLGAGFEERFFDGSAPQRQPVRELLPRPEPGPHPERGDRRRSSRFPRRRAPTCCRSSPMRRPSPRRGRPRVRWPTSCGSTPASRRPCPPAPAGSACSAAIRPATRTAGARSTTASI